MNKKQIQTFLDDAKGKCFKSFNPTRYREVDGYAKNEAFANTETEVFISLADRALVCFTRLNGEYEIDLKRRSKYVSNDEKRRLKKNNKRFPDAFSLDPFRAYPVEGLYFEESTQYVLNELTNIINNISWGDLDEPHLYDILLRHLSNNFMFDRDPIVLKSGRIYDLEHIMAVFSLWCLDKAILSMKSNNVISLAFYLINATEAVNVSEERYSQKLSGLQAKKKKSENQAKRGEASHANLNSIKALIIDKYLQQGEKNKWKSYRRAAVILYEELSADAQNKFVSREGAIKTISKWLSEADPNGDYNLHKKS